MKIYTILLLMAAILVANFPANAADPLPLPRFVTLKSGEANVRTGPGLRYQIKWVLVRSGMPLEVIAEFEQWRKVRDVQGGEGWLHRSMLSGKRTALLTQDNVLMRRSEEPDSYPIARIELGVHSELLECEEKFCEIAVDGFQGWVPRDAIWGIYGNEKI